MPSDYQAIRVDNMQRYGTDIGRIGPMLLANRYDDRTHFIFELLQNAEDALAKRGEQEGQRAVEFSLSPDSLTVTHFGKPFDEDDVRGICGIGESTKGLTSIGRFGIGFKSVYAFTESPEIHSGSEHFAIDSYVWPRTITRSDLPPAGTTIRLPFRNNDSTAATEILAGLQRLGPRTLLFLSEIEEISWSSIAAGSSGLYMRSKPESLGGAARKVMVVGQNKATDDVEEEWIIFSRSVFNAGENVGRVELAFALEDSGDGAGLSVRRIADSALVVFFPTVLATNLGFLVQGPYRTTPSRDNVPVNDPWNQHLVQETSVLLVDALRELRQLGLLNVSVLRSMPLDAARFQDGSRFAPLFSAVRNALTTEPLLPRYNIGYVAAEGARLARTQDLRDLIGPGQLADLFQSNHELVWLSEDITADRTPDLHEYLIEKLNVDEVTPEWLLPRLTLTFLEAQPDEWIERLYAFLDGQRALLPRLRRLPLVRLEDGSHVVAYNGDHPQAFLPAGNRTGFPTVRRSVCRLEEASAFLKSLGLSHPDPVDDVIANVLPKYDQNHVDVPDPDHRSDVERVLAAFATDSTSQHDRLVSALRKVRFVRSVDAGDGSAQFIRPVDVYQATQRMKDLFASVSGVPIVDDSKDYLRGQRIRDLLVAAGSQLYLAPSDVESPLTREEKARLRREAGTEEISAELAVRDHTLRGLEPLLATIASLADGALDRAALLWEALCDVGDRRGVGAFQGEYRWRWFIERNAVFDAYFVGLLNETAWIPDEHGVLQRPRDVIFESTGWEANPFLLTKIRFKSPIIDELAREAGIDPGVLGLLAQYGLTSVEQLTSQLRRAGLIDVEGGAASTPGAEVPKSVEPNEPADSNYSGSPKTRPRTNSGGQRRFISYLAVSPNEEERDPDSLTQQGRMALEEKAIKLILEQEPGLKRTPPNNPGFDLTELGPDGQQLKWVEVKAMTGTLQERPVGISHTQFKCAQEHGQAYWIYVVENAESSERGCHSPGSIGQSSPQSLGHPGHDRVGLVSGRS